MIALSNDTNEQLSDTCVYQVIPAKFTCSMISDFRLKSPCSSVRGKINVCPRSQILIIVEKCYQGKIFG